MLLLQLGEHPRAVHLRAAHQHRGVFSCAAGRAANHVPRVGAARGRGKCALIICQVRPCCYPPI